MTTQEIDFNVAEIEVIRRNTQAFEKYCKAQPVEPFAGDILTDSGRTDSANARRFVDRFKSEILFIPVWKKWLAWDGKRWADDGGVGLKQRAKRYADSLWQVIATAAKNGCDRDELGTLTTFVRRTNERSRIADFVDLANCDERIVCQVAQLNKNPLLLNVQNGTINLETGQLQPHCPGDRITQMANVRFDPNADCPEWKKTIDLIFDGDKPLALYFQELLGYSVSGLVNEHILPICYGFGRNGKSTVWNSVAKLLGDYAKLASAELLMPTKTNNEYAKADLYQARFVAISEPNQGRHLDEATAKELSGGDLVAARRPFEMPFCFAPTHKLWISTNHKPKIRGTDEGIWRRLKLIPFMVDIAKKTQVKTGFSDWLVEHEGPGILNWLIAGFNEWRHVGFDEPESVRVATANYRQAEDQVGQFLADHCVTGEGLEVRASDLFRAYQETGGRLSQTVFGEQVGNRFEGVKKTSGANRLKKVYLGVGLLNSE